MHKVIPLNEVLYKIATDVRVRGARDARLSPLRWVARIMFRWVEELGAVSFEGRQVVLAAVPHDLLFRSVHKYQSLEWDVITAALRCIEHIPKEVLAAELARLHQERNGPFPAGG